MYEQNFQINKGDPCQIHIKTDTNELEEKMDDIQWNLRTLIWINDM